MRFIVAWSTITDDDDDYDDDDDDDNAAISSSSSLYFVKKQQYNMYNAATDVRCEMSVQTVGRHYCSR